MDSPDLSMYRSSIGNGHIATKMTPTMQSRMARRSRLGLEELKSMRRPVPQVKKETESYLDEDHPLRLPERASEHTDGRLRTILMTNKIRSDETDSTVASSASSSDDSGVVLNNKDDSSRKLPRTNVSDFSANVSRQKSSPPPSQFIPRQDSARNRMPDSLSRSYSSFGDRPTASAQKASSPVAYSTVVELARARALKQQPPSFSATNNPSVETAASSYSGLADLTSSNGRRKTSPTSAFDPVVSVTNLTASRHQRPSDPPATRGSLTRHSSHQQLQSAQREPLAGNDVPERAYYRQQDWVSQREPLAATDAPAKSYSSQAASMPRNAPSPAKRERIDPIRQVERLQNKGGGSASFLPIPAANYSRDPDGSKVVTLGRDAEPSTASSIDSSSESSARVYPQGPTTEKSILNHPPSILDIHKSSVEDSSLDDDSSQSRKQKPSHRRKVSFGSLEYRDPENMKKPNKLESLPSPHTSRFFGLDGSTPLFVEQPSSVNLEKDATTRIPPSKDDWVAVECPVDFGGHRCAIEQNQDLQMSNDQDCCRRDAEQEAASCVSPQSWGISFAAESNAPAPFQEATKKRETKERDRDSLLQEQQAIEAAAAQCTTPFVFGGGLTARQQQQKMQEVVPKKKDKVKMKNSGSVDGSGSKHVEQATDGIFGNSLLQSMSEESFPLGETASRDSFAKNRFSNVPKTTLNNSNVTNMAFDTQVKGQELVASMDEEGSRASSSKSKASLDSAASSSSTRKTNNRTSAQTPHDPVTTIPKFEDASQASSSSRSKRSGASSSSHQSKTIRCATMSGENRSLALWSKIKRSASSRPKTERLEDILSDENESIDMEPYEDILSDENDSFSRPTHTAKEPHEDILSDENDSFSRPIHTAKEPHEDILSDENESFRFKTNPIAVRKGKEPEEDILCDDYESRTSCSKSKPSTGSASSRASAKARDDIPSKENVPCASYSQSKNLSGPAQEMSHRDTSSSDENGSNSSSSKGKCSPGSAQNATEPQEMSYALEVESCAPKTTKSSGSDENGSNTSSSKSKRSSRPAQNIAKHRNIDPLEVKSHASPTTRKSSAAASSFVELVAPSNSVTQDGVIPSENENFASDLEGGGSAAPSSSSRPMRSQSASRSRGDSHSRIVQKSRSRSVSVSRRPHPGPRPRRVKKERVVAVDEVSVLRPRRAKKERIKTIDEENSLEDAATLASECMEPIRNHRRAVQQQVQEATLRAASRCPMTVGDYTLMVVKTKKCNPKRDEVGEEHPPLIRDPASVASEDDIEKNVEIMWTSGCGSTFGNFGADDDEESVPLVEKYLDYELPSVAGEEEYVEETALGSSTDVKETQPSDSPAQVEVEPETTPQEDTKPVEDEKEIAERVPGKNASPQVGLRVSEILKSVDASGRIQHSTSKFVFAGQYLMGVGERCQNPPADGNASLLSYDGSDSDDDGSSYYFGDRFRCDADPDNVTSGQADQYNTDDEDGYASVLEEEEYEDDEDSYDEDAEFRFATLHDLWVLAEETGLLGSTTASAKKNEEVKTNRKETPAEEPFSLEKSLWTLADTLGGGSSNIQQPSLWALADECGSLRGKKRKSGLPRNRSCP